MQTEPSTIRAGIDRRGRVGARRRTCRRCSANPAVQLVAVGDADPASSTLDVRPAAPGRCAIYEDAARCWRGKSSIWSAS